jgi:hypothetical protein
VVASGSARIQLCVDRCMKFSSPGCFQLISPSGDG